MKRQLVLLVLAMGVLVMGCATNRDMARSGTYDYAPRWIVYAIHPVGWFLDVTVVGPVTGIVCTMPKVTGCTPNDEMGIQR